MSAGAAGGGSPREVDERWMRRCLELARRAEGRTSPNPMVGCVIVDAEGRLLGEGYHARAGEPHAEIVALEAAGGRAPGATMYVNLEPCRHTEQRRTSPCAPVVAQAGIDRLVYGILDPIASHGGGAAWLAATGVTVRGGVLEAECAHLNRGFITWARHGRPHVTLKAAMTLDGRIATRTGDSKWITGDKARRHAHGERDRVDAIVCGVGTVIADDPQLTARVPGGRDPMRVVVDARLDTPAAAKVLPRHSESPARVVIAATAEAPAARERALRDAGAEIWRLPGSGGRVDVGALAARLGQEELTSALVEGGAELHASFVSAHIADELLLYVAPIAVGEGGKGWLGGAGADVLADAPRFEFAGDPERVGEDLVLRLIRRRSPGQDASATPEAGQT
jgi:diaminohydroxyphosphoribosylaminopyrimidine deaminase / 5-amino-6-(5-phosphoribosylamino)uracil reductase